MTLTFLCAGCRSWIDLDRTHIDEGPGLDHHATDPHHAERLDEGRWEPAAVQHDVGAEPAGVPRARAMRSAMSVFSTDMVRLAPKLLGELQGARESGRWRSACRRRAAAP